MKIVSWNCNGAFRKKFDKIDELRADLYIIQECEDPKQTSNKPYESWASNYLWTGESKNKGIGIFAKESIELKKLDWSDAYKDHSVKYFLPCLINNDFQLLGIWTHRNNSPNFGYIGQFWKYLETNIEKFSDIIIGGDLNSNTIWDQWDRWWNHSDVVQSLEKRGIFSLYHLWHKEDQGKESIPTFFLQRNEEKPFHIDYIFASKNYAENLGYFAVLTEERWLEISDHRPLFMKTRTANNL